MDKLRELEDIATYYDLLSGLRNTPDGQRFLTWFQTNYLTSNKGEVNFDKVLDVVAENFPDKASLLDLLKKYAEK